MPREEGFSGTKTFLLAWGLLLAGLVLWPFRWLLARLKGEPPP